MVNFGQNCGLEEVLEEFWIYSRKMWEEISDKCERPGLLGESIQKKTVGRYWWWCKMLQVSCGYSNVINHPFLMLAICWNPSHRNGEEWWFMALLYQHCWWMIQVFPSPVAWKDHPTSPWLAVAHRVVPRGKPPGRAAWPLQTSPSCQWHEYLRRGRSWWSNRDLSPLPSNRDIILGYYGQLMS